MSLRSGKLPFLGSEDEFFDHTGFTLAKEVFVSADLLAVRNKKFGKSR